MWIGRGFTFAEHLRLAQQFAVFLLDSSGSCVWELHHVLSDRDALQSHILTIQRREGRAIITCDLLHPPCLRLEGAHISCSWVWSSLYLVSQCFPSVCSRRTCHTACGPCRQWHQKPGGRLLHKHWHDGRRLLPLCRTWSPPLCQSFCLSGGSESGEDIRISESMTVLYIYIVHNIYEL